MNENNKLIYICEDNIEGIFTAIYDAFSSVCRHEATHNNIEIVAGDIENYELFCEYLNIDTDQTKASKVTKTICDKMGFQVYETLLYASTCSDSNKANAIYKTIIEGLKLNNGFKILNLWSNDNVSTVLELSRKGHNEFCRWREFLEFRELENGILYSKIGPTCDIVSLLSSHFENRLPNENFMIHDELRDIFLIHEAGHKCVLVSGESFSSDRSILEQYSENDLKMCELFNEFTHTIAIKERVNYKLQQQMMPLRIQKYKVEF